MSGLLEIVAGYGLLIFMVGLQDLQDRSIAKWDCWPAVGGTAGTQKRKDLR